MIEEKPLIEMICDRHHERNDKHYKFIKTVRSDRVICTSDKSLIYIVRQEWKDELISFEKDGELFQNPLKR